MSGSLAFKSFRPGPESAPGVWVPQAPLFGWRDITTLSCRTKNYPKMNKSKN